MVVPRPVNANPGLQINQSITFCSPYNFKLFFTAYVLCRLRLMKLKTEDQTIYTENLTAKFKNHLS